MSNSTESNNNTTTTTNASRCVSNMDEMKKLAEAENLTLVDDNFDNDGFMPVTNKKTKKGKKELSTVDEKTVEVKIVEKPAQVVVELSDDDDEKNDKEDDKHVEVKQELKSQPTKPAWQVKPTLDNDDDFKTVTYKKTPKPKPSVEQYVQQAQQAQRPQKQQFRTQQNRSQTYQKVQDQEKPRQPSKKHEAMLEAQDEFISDFLEVIDKKKQEEINTNLKYVIDYRRTLVVSCERDVITIYKDDTSFEFFRSEFFMRFGVPNKTFQHKLREKIKQLIPDAWISFKGGREFGTYCMTFSQIRN